MRRVEVRCDGKKKTGVRQMYAKQEKQNKVKFLKELRDFKA